ncbi:TonB-dependent receptor domain-containing protein [Salipiger abyssi]|uniref:TonB-dependent receptor domain-containing protein n=1 Tax=Salipiger abyssi TaxID=1250539 RepID=UPI00405A22C0
MRLKRLKGSTCLALALACALPAAAMAETSRSLDIAAQNLIDAIDQLGAQSGRQILGPDELLRMKTSLAVRGPMAPRQALEHMLGDTSMKVDELADGTLIISGRERMNFVSQDATEDFYDLGTIVVTAAGFAQQITDAPATITVIDSEEIESKPYASISDVIRDVPGVIVSAPSTRSGSESISIRGLGEDYVLILVDGKPIGNSGEAAYNGYGSGLSKTQLPPAAAIDQIEVIRGPMSSLYGSAASGGVINIITKPVADAWSGSMTLGSTTYENDDLGESKEARFYMSGPLVQDRLGLALFGSVHDRHKPKMEYSSRGNIAEEQQDIRRRSLGARLNWVIDDRQELTFEVLGSENETETVDEDGDTGGVTSETTNYSLTHDLSWGSGFETTSFLTFSDTDFENGNNISGYEMLNFNTKTSMSFERHDMTVGFDYRNELTIHDLDRFLADPQDQDARPDAEMERWHWALFGEDNFRLTDDLTVTFGLRYDDNEKYGDKWTPRLYGVWHATPSLTIKGGVSGGYKVPTLKQADSNIFESAGGGRGTDQGNTSLEPEETTNYEVGVVWESSGGTQLGLTAYHTQFKNGIDRETVCDIDIDGDCGNRPDGSTNQWIRQYVNRDKAELTGIEATADFTLGAVDVALNYTYAESEITSGDGKGEDFNNNPNHVVNVGLDWQATDALSTWLNAQYRSETLDDGDSQIEAHTIVNLGMDYQFNDRLTGSLAVYNVADRTFGTTNYNDGRSLYVGLTSHF